MKWLFFFISFFSINILHAQSVGIGTATPSASAQLEVNSTTQGFLPPRMTIVQRNAITNPAAGLMIWCTDYKQIQVFDGGTWKSIGPDFSSTIICGKVWMTKNLDVATYANGDPIPQVTDNATWVTLTTGAYCYFNNDSATYASTYGKLYNWYAVNDPRGLAPPGWHIPSSSEYSSLISCLGGQSLAGGPLKEAGTFHWASPNTGATNSSGFTAIPSGIRFNVAPYFDFLSHQFGYFWSSSPDTNPTYAMGLALVYNTTSAFVLANDKAWGIAVRCVKD